MEATRLRAITAEAGPAVPDPPRCLRRRAAQLAPEAGLALQVGGTPLPELDGATRVEHLAEVHAPRAQGAPGADLVVAAGVLAAVPDLYAGLRTIALAARPGAIVLVSMPNAGAVPAASPLRQPIAWAERALASRRPEVLSGRRLVSGGAKPRPDVHVTRAELTALATDAGFAVVACRSEGTPPVPGRAARAAAVVVTRLGAGMGTTLVAELRRSAAAPRVRPRRPWWPAHLAAGLPLDYLSPRTEVARLVPRSARCVLDVGCSGGALGESLRALGARVTGVELDPRLAALAAEVLDGVVVGDAADVLSSGRGLDPDGYDCIIAADCLEHLADPWTALRDAARRLRPGGRIILSVPNVRHWSTLWALGARGTWPLRDSGIHDRTHLRFFTRRSVVDLLGSTELEPERIVGVPRLREGRPSPLDAAGRLLPGAAGELVTFQWLVVARQRR